jgi:eukaryotic-like serine/threonine-protein kinase
MTRDPGAPAVGGRYRLEDPIASGGMGDVWRAADELLGRQVAVKILKPGFGDDASFRLRFRAEARASASLSHLGVATVYDYGEQVAGGIHTAYLVMELVPGELLSALLARRVTIDPARTMDVVAQTAGALQAAHDRGIVHRDIKPANLLVRPDGNIKITDFGIARAADAMALTQTGMLLGTVAYMSPEQLSGLTATPASDLYSLGVVAYLCLVGRTPFASVEQMAVAVAHVRDDVPPLPNEVPPAVRDVVYQLLDKDPARRPGSAGELAATAAGIRGQLVGEPVPTAPTVPPSPLAPLADLLGRLPTVEAVGATKAATAVAHPPLGVGGPAGNRATVALPDHTRPDHTQPDHARPPLPEPRRHRRRVAIAVLAGIALLALALGLWASSGTSMITVPEVQHQPVSTAVSVITKAGLRASTRPVDRNEPTGLVVTQIPGPRARVSAGSTVTLAVSSGYLDLSPTGLIGQQYPQVAASITLLGLLPSRRETASSSPAGTVLAVTPNGRVKVGATITLWVAVAPPPTTTVPTTRPPTTTVPTTKATAPTVPTTKPTTRTEPTTPTVPTTTPTAPTLPTTEPSAPTTKGNQGQGGNRGDFGPHQAIFSPASSVVQA